MCCIRSNAGSCAPRRGKLDTSLRRESRQRKYEEGQWARGRNNKRRPTRDTHTHKWCGEPLVLRTASASCVSRESRVRLVATFLSLSVSHTHFRRLFVVSGVSDVSLKLQVNILCVVWCMPLPVSLESLVATVLLVHRDPPCPAVPACPTCPSRDYTWLFREFL